MIIFNCYNQCYMYFLGKFKIYDIYVCDLQAQIRNRPWSTYITSRKYGWVGVLWRAMT